MIHRCQVWVVNAVLGRDRIAGNTLQPPHPTPTECFGFLRTPQARISQHISSCTFFLLLALLCIFNLATGNEQEMVQQALFTEKTLLTSSHMAQWASAGNHKSSEWKDLLPVGGFDWSWCWMVVCCFYYHIQIKCFDIVSFNLFIGQVLSLQLPGDYGCFLW